jgi:thiol:disulfide interchange protein
MPPVDGVTVAGHPTTRARPRLLLALAATFLVARVATGLYEAYRPPRPGGLVRWVTPAEVDGIAATTRKPILYDFSAAWCEPCKEMERELFSDAATANFINDNYIAVRVADEDQSDAATALRRRHQVTALPTIVVKHPDSAEPRRQQGYPGKRQAAGFLRAAARGK